jgi:hypothetical protein
MRSGAGVMRSSRGRRWRSWGWWMPVLRCREAGDDEKPECSRPPQNSGIGQHGPILWLPGGG